MTLPQSILPELPDIPTHDDDPFPRGSPSPFPSISSPRPPRLRVKTFFLKCSGCPTQYKDKTPSPSTQTPLGENRGGGIDRVTAPVPARMRRWRADVRECPALRLGPRSQTRCLTRRRAGFGMGSSPTATRRIREDSRPDNASRQTYPIEKIAAVGLEPTHPRTRDFESRASTNSATPPW